MDKQVKVYLKAAKEAIKSEDYHAVLENSQSALDLDESNYTAYVFCGIAYKEIGGGEKCVSMFQKAIQLSSELPLAWQGLGAYYEKLGSSKNEDALIEIYTKLLTVFPPSGPKTKDVCSKLAWVQVHKGMVDECLKTLDLWRLACDVEIYDSSNILLAMKDKTVSTTQMVAILSHVAASKANSLAIARDLACYQLSLLYRLSDWSELLRCAAKMRSTYEDSVLAAEWMLRSWLEGDLAMPDVDQLVSFLSAAESDNVWCRVARARLAADGFKWTEVVELLGGKLSGDASRVWIVHSLRGRAQLALHRYPQAERSLKSALKVWPKHVSAVDANLNLAETLIHQCGVKTEEALGVLESVSDLVSDKQLERYRYLKLEVRLISNELALDEALATPTPLDIVARIHVRDGNLLRAIALLKETNSNRSPAFLRLLARCLWEADDAAASVPVLREAIEADPYHWEPFYYLAQYLLKSNQGGVGGSSGEDRALRCLEKACRLSPGESSCNAALSDLYRARSQHEKNILLLTAVTESEVTSASSHQWAWLRLGIHYLQAEEYQRAVTSLQTVVKTDSGDSVGWECLGDAYRLRGAYASAVEAYSRAAQLADNPLYARLQLANLQLSRGRLEVAADEYDAILATSPDYIPALKGAAETQVARARQLAAEFRFGSARDCYQRASGWATIAVRAKPELGCLWKDLGDVLHEASALPGDCGWLELPPYVTSGNKSGSFDSEENSVRGGVLVDLASRCFVKALEIHDDASLWHSLAQCYLTRIRFSDGAECKQWSLRACKCAQKATELCATNAVLWNTLGVAAARSETPQLAQHALIQSLQLKESAMAWTNLASIYLTAGDASLAHEALSRAQSCDPTSAAAWTGQALVAELLAPEQATDLFRHAVVLGQLPQAQLGYGHWVFNALLDPSVWGTREYAFNIDRMCAVTVAHEALTFYVSRNDADASAWNMLGMLAEREGYMNESLNAYKRALGLLEHASTVDAAVLDKVRVNLCRALTAAGSVGEAVTHLKRISAASFHSQCALALALYRSGQLAESFSAYDSALHWLMEDDAHKSHVLVAAGCVLYSSGDVPGACKLLLNSFQLEPASIDGVLALTVLALRCRDPVLARACHTELVPLTLGQRHEEEHAVDAALLLSCLQAGDDVRAASRVLQKACLGRPHNSRAWRLLATSLLTRQPRQALLAARTASTLTASQTGAANSAPINDTNTEYNTVESLVCQCYMRCGDVSGCHRSAQLSVLLRPDSPAAWCDLIAATLAQLVVTAADRDNSCQQLAWLQSAVTQVKRGQLSRPLLNWVTDVDSKLLQLASA